MRCPQFARRRGALIPHLAAGYQRNQAGQLENSPLLDSSYKIPGGDHLTLQ